MFTLAIFLTFISIYCLYSVANKVEIEPKGSLLYLKTNKSLALALSGSAIVLGTLIYSWQLGFAVGIFTSLLVWMLLACLMVLFIPFDKVKRGHLILCMLLIGIIELSVLFLS